MAAFIVRPLSPSAHPRFAPAAQQVPAAGEGSIPICWVPETNRALLPAGDEFPGFEQTLYALCKANRDEEAIAEALDYFDDRLIDRQFQECDRAFRRLRVSKLASSVMVSLLGITIRAKTLQGRAIFFERAFQEITCRKGKRYASQLLEKYR